VLPVNSKPTGIGLSNLQVRELSASGTLVGTLSAMDPDKGETFTYALVNDAGGRFQIVGNQLQVKNGVALDYEQSGLFKAPSVKVLVTDKGGLTFEQSFMLSVTNWTTEVTPGSGFDDVIIGDRGKDRLGGGAGNDRLEGATANDTLSGGSGHDLLKGGSNVDTLAGGTGNDRLYGGLGKDVLSGNTGKDVFVFDAKLSKSTNVDTVKDYNVRDDTIWLENKIFTKIGRAGSEKKPVKLSSDAFHVGKAAADAQDRIVYDKATGALFYDRDGSGAAAVQFATLKKGLGLSHHDFFVI
ncbi:MAG TPA: cadherin domain-containing protein, partial [Microvirga sp.]|nr:cadherin domain-containing protein [Microvirga sp.]